LLAGIGNVVTSAEVATRTTKELAQRVINGPEMLDRQAAIEDLLGLGDAEANHLLCSILVDGSVSVAIRKMVYRGLALRPELISTVDVSRILAMKEPWDFFVQDAMIGFYPKCRMTPESMAEACAKYATLAKGYRAYVMLFTTRHHQTFAADAAYLATVRSTVEKFLTNCAVESMDAPSSLRTYIGEALLEYGFPGGPEVLITVIMDELAANRVNGSAAGAIRLLAKFTGMPTGFANDRRKHDDEEILRVGAQWKKWWWDNNTKPGYVLPLTPEQAKARKAKSPF